LKRKEENSAFIIKKISSGGVKRGVSGNRGVSGSGVSEIYLSGKPLGEKGGGCTRPFSLIEVPGLL